MDVSASNTNQSATPNNSTAKLHKFDSNSTALEVVSGVSLTGKYAIVTGASSGIGLETCRALASAGCHVVLACRDVSKANKVVDALKTENSSISVEIMYLDLEKLVTVKQFAMQYLTKGYPLHFLVLNAGMYATSFKLTEDGFETTFQVNHLSHFYVCNLLTEKLIASAPSRVVFVSSEAHRFTSVSSESKFTRDNLSPREKPFWSLGTRHYGSTKLCNMFNAKRLHELLHDKGVSIFSLHPGLIPTDISRTSKALKFFLWSAKAFAKTPQQGAATSVYCCVGQDLEKLSGHYFQNCAVCEPDSFAKNTKIPQRLWEISESMIAEAAAKFPES